MNRKKTIFARLLREAGPTLRPAVRPQGGADGRGVLPRPSDARRGQEVRDEQDAYCGRLPAPAVREKAATAYRKSRAE